MATSSESRACGESANERPGREEPESVGPRREETIENLRRAKSREEPSERPRRKPREHPLPLVDELPKEKLQ